MENSNNGRIFIEANQKLEIQKPLMITKNDKLLNQGLETTDPLISKIFKIMKSKRIVSQSSYNHLLEFPTSLTNHDYQKRKIDRIKENIASNQKQIQECNLHEQIKSKFDLHKEQKSRGNIGSFSKPKNMEFMTFEDSNIEKNDKNKEINLVKLNFPDLLQQMRIKSSNTIAHKVTHRKIIFKASIINQKKLKCNLLDPNKHKELKSNKNKGNLCIVTQSNNYLKGLRPETTLKVNSTKNLLCERPLSRYNKNSLFSKIESNTNLKKVDVLFPVKNMNLVFGPDNLSLLPSSWK